MPMDILDRWYATAEELTLLLDKLKLSTGPSDTGYLNIQFISTETYFDVLHYFLRASHKEVDIETLESYASRAEAAFSFAEKALPMFDCIRDNIPNFFDWRKPARCGRTLRIFIRAVCLQRQGAINDAIAKCKEAVASAESLPEQYGERDEFIYLFGIFLNDNKEYWAARDAFEKVYCSISEKSGPGDERL
jgi:tetratricopeptide (TPR) repeat protein